MESVGLRKSLLLAPDRRSDYTAKCLHFLAIQQGGQNSWHRQNVEITSLLTYL